MRTFAAASRDPFALSDPRLARPLLRNRLIISERSISTSHPVIAR